MDAERNRALDPRGESFCVVDGSFTERKIGAMTCGGCQKESDTDSVFCRYCGKRIAPEPPLVTDNPFDNPAIIAQVERTANEIRTLLQATARLTDEPFAALQACRELLQRFPIPEISNQVQFTLMTSTRPSRMSSTSSYQWSARGSRSAR